MEPEIIDSHESLPDKPRTRLLSHQYSSPSKDNLLKVQTRLPKIIELEREDSSAYPNAPRENETKYLDEIFQDYKDFKLENIIDEIPSSPIDEFKNHNERDDDNFSLEIKKSGGKNTKIYRMNRDLNYTSTSGGSRKESVTNIGKLEKKPSPRIENPQTNFFNEKEFNAKIFCHSLSDGHKLYKSNNYGEWNRKYSEPVHSNGGQTIFGHLQELKIIQIKKAIKNVKAIKEDGKFNLVENGSEDYNL